MRWIALILILLSYLCGYSAVAEEPADVQSLFRELQDMKMTDKAAEATGSTGKCEHECPKVRVGTSASAD